MTATMKVHVFNHDKGFLYCGRTIDNVPDSYMACDSVLKGMRTGMGCKIPSKSSRSCKVCWKGYRIAVKATKV